MDVFQSVKPSGDRAEFWIADMCGGLCCVIVGKDPKRLENVKTFEG